MIENVPHTRECIQYTALSYCWGDSDSTVAVLLNELPFRLTSNLHDALVAISRCHYDRLDKRHYWIDALCINQKNVEERSQQVAQMWRIFSGAEQVLAWLGNDFGQRDEAAFDTLQAFGREDSDWKTTRTEAIGIHARADPAILHHKPEATWMVQLREKYRDTGQQGGEPSGPIQQLLNRRYFTRLWMIAELVNARSLILICGASARTCSWEALDLYIEAFGLSEKLPPPALARHQIYRRILQGQPNDTSPPRIVELANLLKAFACADCSDPRDTIFAAFSHPVIRRMATPEQLVPDYSMTTDEVAMVALEWLDQVFPTSAISILKLTLKCLKYGLKLEILEDMFETWAKGHEWDCSQWPDEIKLKSGKVVSLKGARLSRLATGRWSDF